MAKITVDLEAFYGYGCGFQSYSSNDTIEVEVSETELNTLKNIGKDKISAEDIVAAIESGDTSLRPLHDKLSDEFYNMVEEYWLFEAYNECLYECLAEHIEQDINDGLYTPKTSEEDDDYNIDVTEEDDEDCEDEEFEDDEDYYEEDEDNYDLDAYFDWVKEHDHDFAAERVGLDLYACREDRVNYTITIEK